VITWAYAKDHEWVYEELLHYIWHDAVRGKEWRGARELPRVPKSEVRVGSWDNNCGAIMEQLWAIRENLAEYPESK